MRAMQYYGPGDVRLEEIPEPVVGPGQGKIKVCTLSSNLLLTGFLTTRQVARCGICGSDLHLYDGALQGPHPLRLNHILSPVNPCLSPCGTSAWWGSSPFAAT
ncbi:hypothetical protein GSI_09534 [Ganoderma sinense ZZ0214-1]|uniref:Uncharacterized protein n=1 Tax=Ganoderma sinense ZZ0214-1 TaxID=1077348 RepID=A0A2G8S3M0_9APHY|nr:hypothetical protein GSI_09534 [Ganoderma sinense ZZ0214-1]